ncbi:type II toxin-antitoxin system VapC family toxin [Candidatus Pyrohabitans sp.]
MGNDMTIFIDTGIFFSAFNEDDMYHLDALGIYISAFSGRFGAVYTSDYIIDETATLLKIKARPEIALKFLKSALSSSMLIVRIDERIFKESCRIFEKYFEKAGVSFTDATTIATLRLLEIENIASFDGRGFDGIVKNRIGEGFWKTLGEDKRREILKKLSPD